MTFKNWLRAGFLLLVCSAEVQADDYETEPGAHLFPRRDTFAPLVADPKQVRSFLGLQVGANDFDTTIGAVGVGDRVGLVRWNSEAGDVSVNLAVSAGVFSQFDLDATSFDLINADYVVGLPVTLSAGTFSARLRFYHQSSHLGDEFLLGLPEPDSTRENLSFESLEGIVSLHYSGARLYAGWEFLVNREPEALEQNLLHLGAEFRGGRFPAVGDNIGRLLLALDVKCSEERNWRAAWSARAGFEFGGDNLESLLSGSWAIVYEFYDGPSPYGQFFRDDIVFNGVGVHFLR